MKSESAKVDPPLSYEAQLNQNSRWAMKEGSNHFEKNSAVFAALYKIAAKLKSLNVPYAIVGGMALFEHGFRRFTEDVDILVTQQSLELIHEKLSGLGYLPPFEKSKNLRDTMNGVRIEFIITGQYPGDGKEKPVAFPDPANVSFEADGIAFLELASLVELKLASGISNAGRLKDLADVLELIKIKDLPVDFAEKINPYVREKYRELWQASQI